MNPFDALDLELQICKAGSSDYEDAMENWWEPLSSHSANTAIRQAEEVMILASQALQEPLKVENSTNKYRNANRFMGWLELND